jgi:predicted PurR-regulated permease PerM
VGSTEPTRSGDSADAQQTADDARRSADDSADSAAQSAIQALFARGEAVSARAAADESAESAAAADEAEGAAEEAEHAAEDAAHAAEDAEEAAEEAEQEVDLGEPGEPISRHTPFYIGFVGGFGVLTAIALGEIILHARSVIVLVVVAAFIAVGLDPVVQSLVNRGVRRSYAVLIVTLGLLAIVTLFVVSLVPVLRDQLTQIVDNAPGWLNQLRHNRTFASLDRKYDVIDKVNARLQNADFASTAFGSVFSVGLAVLSALFNAFIIFVLTLYFLSALPRIKEACYSLAPASRRDRIRSLSDEILRQVGGYVSGALIVALCAGTSSFIFLSFVGLSGYALALALVVAITDFIPLVGATIGASIVSLIGFANGVGIGIACVIFYIAYQQVENYVIYPRVMRSSVNVPGVVTVVAVLIGGTLMGVVGALLAIPTAAGILLIVREVVFRRQETV